ncbi:type I-C CRISPR-associated protein Cas8c/Csd1 [Streptomyces sp. NBC_01207]|uniref:type I-C CRISPR-associated protein Cas8c/Csd1 n=1 Tax=Streptomyces sp. NBC_01207 TaxID=2903772 RepID=UPI002E0F45A3|nr:type I-C CRISPR-associated protein Cas8c/Csd1 [Streptomyces sp. NBC_01207]
MILQRLVEHGRTRSDLPLAYHRVRAVQWLATVDTNSGNPVVTITDLRPAKGEKRREVNAPYVGRSGVKAPAYLAVDKAEYVLALGAPGRASTARETEKAARAHAAYRELLNEWTEAEPHDETAQLVAAAAAQFSTVDVPADMKPTDVVAVVIDDTWAHEAPTAAAFWTRTAEARASGQTAESGHGVCLVCGEAKQLVGVLVTTVKGGPTGIPSTGKTGDNRFITNNEPAFARNGGSQLTNTPICGACGDLSATTVNALLADREHSLKGPDWALVWWTREPVTDALLGGLDDPEPGEVASLLGRLNKPTAATAATVDTNAFFAATLAVNAGRIIVRDWLDVSLPVVQDNLARWFADHQTFDPWTGQTVAHPLWRLTLAGARYDRRGGRYVEQTTPHNLRMGLLHAALHGTPPPASLLPVFLQRVRGDQHMDGYRLALLRLLLTRTPHLEGTALPQLNTEAIDPGYLCGRAFALFEDIQRTALPNVNATVSARFRGTAMTSPGTVFPGLWNNAGNHLKRIGGGLAEIKEARLRDILGLLDDVPAFLTMAQQARFLLGFEHQRAADIAARRAASAAKAAREAADAPTAA